MLSNFQNLIALIESCLLLPSFPLHFIALSSALEQVGVHKEGPSELVANSFFFNRIEAMTAPELVGLPTELFNDDFFINGNRAIAAEEDLSRPSFASCSPSSSETELTETKNDEENYIAKLTSCMAHTFLSEVTGVSTSKVEVPAVLKDRMRFVLSRGSPTGPLQVSSPPSTYLVQRKRQIEPKSYVRRIPSQLQKPSAPSNRSVAGFMHNPILGHQQHQTAQFYQLKQQQLIRQQLAIGSTLPARSSVHHHHPITGMKAVLLDNPHVRRHSAGTGVFLPKRIDIPNESHKPACPSVIPARIFQTLNLNQEDLRFQPRIPGSSARDYGKFLSFFVLLSSLFWLLICDGRLELAMADGNLALAPQKWLQKQNNLYHIAAPPPTPPPSAAVTSPEIRLPTEWTY